MMKDLCARAFTLGVIAGLIGGLYAGIVIINNSWRQQTIEHGCAAYDTHTGEWRFKEQED